MLRLLMALVLLALATPQVYAQQSPESESAAPATDPFGRHTPRATVTGLLNALAAQDYARAANYMPASDGRSAMAEEEAAQVARLLQATLDAEGTLMAFGVLSNDPDGRIDDGLPPNVERVGSFGGERGVPILLARDEGEETPGIWRISPHTIEELRSRAAVNGQDIPPEEDRLLVAGAPIGDWALLLGMAAASFLLFWIISLIIIAVMRRVVADCETSTVFRLTNAALPPLSLFLAVIGFQLWGGSIEASIIARQTLLRYIGIVSWVAIAWFALRLVDAVTDLITNRMERHQRRQAVSVILLMRRAAKVALLAVAFVAILDTLGLDVTTGIAALGIGGIALALGAQKTIENLVGSVSVIADRPVQVGDFCRVGDVTGTVEDIGIRSTRIRTNERTIVTIPNADFSSRQIENFATRDRFLFNPVIGIDYGISAAKLREGVEIIESVLLEHEKVDSDGARARFKNFSPSSLDIEVFAYILETDAAASLTVRQDLLLTIFERLEAAGLNIAYPTQKLYVVQQQE